MTKPSGLTILLVSDGDAESRSIRLSPRRLRLLFGIGAFLVLFLLGLVGSWWYLAARAHRVSQLEAQVEVLLEDQVRVAELAHRFAEVEEGYERIRAMFGADSLVTPGGVWLPPASGPSSNPEPPDGDDHEPTSWPLTERGFVTQPLLEGGGADHPGLDIAIPTGSYIRASGGGRVTEVGEDPVYGYYVRLEHDGGYETLYAHASLLLVEEGDTVVRNEVIALSGSTGRSTAPHLHFEIWRDGVALDPLEMVTPP